ncbi:MAG: lysoplasmalogenase family protein [Novosphingobium sp.]
MALMSDHRFRSIVLASIVAAVGFYLLRTPGPLPTALVVLKGTGVGLLAILALIYGEGRYGGPLTGIMLLGALGDVLIEYDLIAGAAAFLVGHLLALAFYLRNGRANPAPSQKLLALAIVVIVPILGWWMPSDRSMALVTFTYALALALMAAAAWMSRFSRYRVGIGAVLFVLSDLLIFARGGPLASSNLPHLLIWPLYYLGQLLICLGVLRTIHSAAFGARIDR